MRHDLGLEVDGGWIFDPRDLAQRLGVSTRALERSIIEETAKVLLIPGCWVDSGSSRITVHLHDGGWQGTFDQRGQLVAEHVW